MLANQTKEREREREHQNTFEGQLMKKSDDEEDTTVSVRIGVRFMKLKKL